MANINKDFLYYGLAYEYNAIGELFFHGYEAQKITADFGYDLVATNMKRVMDSGETPITRYFQVKARRGKEKILNGVHGMSCFIDFKEEDIKDFIKNDGREKYLRVYISDQQNMHLISFWLSHAHIENLLNCQLLKKEAEKSLYKLYLFVSQNQNGLWELFLVNYDQNQNVQLFRLNDYRLYNIYHINECQNSRLFVDFHDFSLYLDFPYYFSDFPTY